MKLEPLDYCLSILFFLRGVIVFIEPCEFDNWYICILIATIIFLHHKIKQHEN